MSYRLTPGESGEKREPLRGALRRLAPLIAEERRYILVAFAAILVTSAATLASPYVIAQTVDHYIGQGDFSGAVRNGLILLAIMVGLGIATTAVNTPLGFDYRETISVWFRGLFAGNPDGALAMRAPVIFQVHAIAAWVLFLLWPFTRLVHAWSYPLWYLWRPYVVIRSKMATHPPEPGTGGRKWRKIGTPY